MTSGAKHFTRPGRHPDDRAILALAWPALGALAADPLYSLVDTAFVGNLGTPELGALAVGTAAFTASFWLFSFLAYGVTPRVAAALGAADERAAARIGVQALMLATGIGLLVTLSGVAFAGPIVRLLGASGEVAGYAEPYLRIRVLSAIPVLVAQVGHGWLRGAHDTRTPMYIALAGASLNVGLDYVLIYPLGWGVEGAAWATLIGQTCAAVAFLAVLNRRMTGAVWRVEGAVARSLLMVGADLAVRTGSLLAALTLATSIAARMGEVVVASWQIAMQVFLLLAFILDSVAIAGQAMIGRDLGSGDLLRATGVSRRLMEWGLVVGAGLAVLLSALAWPLARVFTDDPEVVATAARLILWVALLQPLAAAAFTLDGILIGASDTRFLAVAMVASSGLFVVCALVALERGWGAPGLAAGATVWMVARTVTTGARWRGGRWTSPTMGRGSPERVSH